MSNVSSYIKDLFLFFWPPLIICAVIGSIAAGKNRRMGGSFVGLASGMLLGLILMLSGPPPGRP
jgi:hypothetical protein